MKRIKWLRFSMKGGIQLLKKRLDERLFHLDGPSTSGFRIEEKTVEAVSGQYISKRTVDQRFLLPSGEVFLQEVTSFEIVKFSIDLTLHNGLLSILEPPRSISPFLNALSEASKFSCVLEPIEVDVVAWIDLLLQAIPESSVTYADVAGIAINEAVLGRVALASRNEATVDPALFSSFGSGGKVESARVRLALPPRGEVVEISSRGTVKVGDRFSNTELKMLRETMLKATL